MQDLKEEKSRIHTAELFGSVGVLEVVCDVPMLYYKSRLHCRGLVI